MKDKGSAMFQLTSVFPIIFFCGNPSYFHSKILWNKVQKSINSVIIWETKNLINVYSLAFFPKIYIYTQTYSRMLTVKENEPTFPSKYVQY
jgi:hypothetical protein